MTAIHRTIIGGLLLIVLADVAAQQPPAPAPQPAAPKVTAAKTSAAAAEKKRQLAHIYRDLGRLDEARKKLEEVLSEDPQNVQAQFDLTQILRTENERAAARQALLLEQAEWELRNGEHSKAIELAQKAADSAQDPKIIVQAQELIRRAGALSPEQFLDRLKGSWLVDIIFAVCFVFLLGLLLWVLRWVVTSCYVAVFQDLPRPTWRVRPINDSTQMAVAEIVMAELSRLSTERFLAPAVSSGLLKAGSALLPRPRTSPGFEQGPAVTLAEPFAALQMKISGFDVGALAKMLSGLAAWFGAKLPAVTGGAFLLEGKPPRVTVWLTRYNAGRNIMTVRETAASKGGSEAARISAEGAAFRMYYLLTYPEQTESDAGAWLNMRRGQVSLQNYIDGKDGQALQQAHRSFAEARNAVSTLWEAHLYEGVTLDLLERHQEAVQLFQYVAANTEGEMHEQALYSEAIAHLRMYRPEHLQVAADLCDQVISAGPDDTAHPTRLLAKVGKANVIAHYPIFWERVLHGKKAGSDPERAAWKKDDVGKLNSWIDQVIQITNDVDRKVEALQKSGSLPWNVKGQLQIQWGSLNAVGNAYLNVADGFLEPPLPAELRGDAAALQQTYLAAALDKFNKSEFILPPGVETLTNLATTYLYMGRYEEARAYLDRAIALNPDYEYAYYRQVQSWDRANNSEEALQALIAYTKPLPVKIREFKDLFTKYGVPLPS
jgi:tetratricopeptide (TPR) repeat protein